MLHTYTSAIKGFAAQLPDAAVTALRNNPNAEYVEQDQTVSLNQTSGITTQSTATWGLDRIDQRGLPLSGAYRYENNGSNVYAFVIDTGVLASHQDFSTSTGLDTRVKPLSGFSAFTDAYGTSDCNGHGTHVAGTMGGNTYGVAKGVTLIPVRVLDCSGSGSWSGVIAGVDLVAGSSLRPAVANMSRGGGSSTSVNNAVANAVTKGVTMVVAAGNDNRDACGYSPASTPSAITVGATSSTDARASYSNFGSCVDIFAPGSSIKSAWYTSNDATNTISGTSMATPHVVGAAALLLSASPSSTPAQITAALINQATYYKVTSAGTGSPNRLLFSVASEATVNLPTVAVSGLTGSAVRVNTTTWRASANVTVRVFDGSNFGAAASGVTVAGSFAPGGGTTCVAGSTGSCTLTSINLSRSGAPSSTLTVTGVSGTGVAYDATKNTASTVTITTR